MVWDPIALFVKHRKRMIFPINKNNQKASSRKPLPKLQAKRPNTLSMTKTKQDWEQEMERLNAKYNLDCFSDSELDSESDKDEQYQYEHGYETLI